MEYYRDLITATLSGILVAVFASILSVSFAVRRFYSEKWWERKADVYSRIVEQLYHVLNSLDSCLYQLEIGKDLPAEDQKVILVKANAAYQELYKTECIGAFIISEDVAAALSEMSEKVRATSAETTDRNLLQARSEAVSHCLNKVKALAKKELKKR